MDLESLKELATKYFPLAYGLLPEELMANQLIIDASCALLLSQEEEVTFQKEEAFESEFISKLIKLAKIRQQHFAHRQPGVFFSLTTEERVILFLKDRMDMKTSRIASILKMEHDQVLSLLHSGRSNVIAGVGETAEGIL